MDFSPGSIRLDDVSGGSLLAGSVPYQRLRRTLVSSKNEALVTITGTLTTLVSLDMGNLVLDDLILISYAAFPVKGATQGTTRITLENIGGSAIVPFIHDDASIRLVDANISASAGVQVAGTLIGRCTQAGPWTVGLTAISNGSNSTLSIGEGQIMGMVLFGS